MQTAIVQPLHDLSIMRRDTPEPLIKAATDPYASHHGDCGAMREEISELNDVLGDDLGDVSARKGSLITDAVKSAVSLPFGSIVRRISGAHKRDQAYEQAVIAGVARRAYLKGSMDVCMVANPQVIPVAKVKMDKGKRILLVPTSPLIIADRQPVGLVASR